MMAKHIQPAPLSHELPCAGRARPGCVIAPAAAPRLLQAAFGPDGCAYIGDCDNGHPADRPLYWIEPLKLVAGPAHWANRAFVKRGPSEHNHHWTEQDDAQLCEHVAEGLTFSKIGELMGRTKGSCIGRFHRIAKQMGAEVFAAEGRGT